MHRLWDTIKKGYLRVIEPVADLLVRMRVSPNVLTTVGSACTVAGGFAFATGHIMLAVPRTAKS